MFAAAITLGVCVVVVGIAVGLYYAMQDRVGALDQLRCWDRQWIPVTVVVDEALVETALVDALIVAVEFWNRAVGVDLFSDVGDVGTGRGVVPVMPYPSAGYERNATALASTHLVFVDGKIESAAVYVDADRLLARSLEEMRRALAHELGHVVGLDHDRELRWSVMHPTASASLSYRVTREDARLLRGAYGPAPTPPRG